MKKATALFATLTVIPVTVVGLAVALLLNQRIRGLGVLRALVLLPWAMPLVSAGIIWRLLLHGNFGALMLSIVCPILLALVFRRYITSGLVASLAPERG